MIDILIFCLMLVACQAVGFFAGMYMFDAYEKYRLRKMKIRKGQVK